MSGLVLSSAGQTAAKSGRCIPRGRKLAGPDQQGRPQPDRAIREVLIETVSVFGARSLTAGHVPPA